MDCFLLAWMLIGWQWATGAFVVLLIVALAILGIFAKWGSYWFQAYMSDADIKMKSLIAMTFLGIDHRMIVTAKIMARQSGLSIDRLTGTSTTGYRLITLPVAM